MNKYFIFFTSILILVVSVSQILYSDTFRIGNVIKDEKINYSYFILLLIPFIQLLLIVLSFRSKKLVYTFLGLLFVVPFCITESKEIIYDFNLEKEYVSYSRGILKVRDYSKEKKISYSEETELTQSIDLAAKYLLKSIKDDGCFQYKRNLNPSYDIYGDEYNILRHAGVIYALSNYINNTNYNKADIKLILKTVRWMERNIIEIDSEDKIKAVWSPAINEDTDINQAKLGGTALTIIAFLEVQKIHSNYINDNLIKSLGNFLLYMQKENGAFYSRYIPQYGGRTDLNYSLFYPGQAILALIYLYEFSKELRWLEAAAKGLSFLIESRKEHDDYPPDHWVLIATRKYYNYIDLNFTKLNYHAVLNHSKRIGETIISYYKTRDRKSKFYGCFSNDGLTCYTASAIEGLASLYQILEVSEQSYKQKIYNIIEEGIQFLLSAQIKTGENAGGIPHTKQPWEITYTEQMEKAGEIRIDYVQHSLSALLLYKEIKNN